MMADSRCAPVLALLVLVLSVATPTSVAVGGNGDEVSESIVSDDFLPQVDVEAEDILIQIEINEDGSADWRIEYRIRLDDETKADSFDSIRENISSNPSYYTDTFERRMVSTANASETATGRRMAIRGMDVSAKRAVAQNHGTVVYTFEWLGFAESSDVIKIGDVLQGFFLDDRTTLVLGWPEEYESSEIVPEPNEGRDSSAVWNGPMEFGQGEPRVVLSSPESPVKPVIGGFIVLSPLAGVGFVVYRRRRRTGEGSSDSEEEREGEVDEEETEDASEEETELLSNEDRVIRELEQNGGRMKQQTLVDSLGWTEAKTSQVVNEMYDEGMIDKYRLGRENVLAMPDDENDEDEQGRL